MQRRRVFLVAAVLLSFVASPVLADGEEEKETEELHIKVSSMTDDYKQIEASDEKRFLLAVYQLSTGVVNCYIDKHTNVLMAGGSDDVDQDEVTASIIDDIVDDPNTVSVDVEKSKVDELFLMCSNMPEEGVQILNELTRTQAPAFNHVAMTKRRTKRLAGWAVYPGTKWCGAGSAAENKDDLGAHDIVDECCRTHDHCEKYIGSWTYKWGMFNWYLWTLSHCDCDDTFKQCLRDVPDGSQKVAAEAVERIFFQLLGIRCFTINGSGYATLRS